MRKNLAALIDVKTIITFALVGAAIVMAFRGIKSENIENLAMIAVTFFLGYKASQVVSAAKDNSENK